MKLIPFCLHTLVRVATNISTTLETILAHERGYDVSRVFSFASLSMPMISVALATRRSVHVYLQEGEKETFNPKELDVLSHIGTDIHFHSGEAPARHEGAITLASLGLEGSADVIDGFVAPHILYIENPEAIPSKDILVIRKRMATPATTPMVENMLRVLAGETVTEPASPTDEEMATFYAHLQTLSGTAVNPSANPVVCTAGLPTIASIWFSLVARGGADILMCSTAYGGSSQLTDLLSERTDLLRKSTFDIQGDAEICVSIETALDKLASEPAKLLPATVLFVEIPTNPDQKIPDLARLSRNLKRYRERTGKDVFLLLATTFPPGSKVLKKLSELNEAQATLFFISMSKSVSRGVTTAGAVVANHTPMAVYLLNRVRKTSLMLDVGAKPDQMMRLVQNHTGVEERCENAYRNTVIAGDHLRAAVLKATGEDMPLAYVRAEHAQEVGAALLETQSASKWLVYHKSYVYSCFR